MSSDPIRERDLASLGVRASVDTANGICTIRLPTVAFEQLIDTWEKAQRKAEAPAWYDDVLGRLEDLESDLTSSIDHIKWEMRDAKKAAEAGPKKATA